MSIPFLRLSLRWKRKEQVYLFCWCGGEVQKEIWIGCWHCCIGELINGRVDLDVAAPVNGAKTLMIKWKGFERTLIQDTIWKENNATNPVCIAACINMRCGCNNTFFAANQIQGDNKPQRRKRFLQVWDGSLLFQRWNCTSRVTLTLHRTTCHLSTNTTLENTLSPSPTSCPKDCPASSTIKIRKEMVISLEPLLVSFFFLYFLLY